MRQLLSVLFSFLMFANSFSQDMVTVREKGVKYGEDIRNSKDIFATEYTFPNRIGSLKLLSNEKILVLTRDKKSYEPGLKSKGKAILYDIKSNTENWHKKFNFGVYSMNVFSHSLVKYNGYNSFLLDTDSGENLWSVNTNLRWYNDSAGVVIGCRLRRYKWFVEGVDFESGEKLWSRKINDDRDSFDALWPNDTTLMFVASGLHSIDVRTGKGWDYETLTTSADLGAILGDDANGVYIGTATDTEYVPINLGSATGFHSKVLYDGDYLFFASRDKIAKLNKNTGEVLWSAPLDKKKMSKSTIFRQDSTLYLINKAYIYYGDSRFNTGEALFAAFDENTGKKRFEIVTDRKGISIRDYLVGEKDILFLYENRIAKYSLVDGSLIAEKYYIFMDDDRLRYFTDENYYVENASSLFCIPKINPESVFVYTKNRNIIAFDMSLKRGETIAEKDIYYTIRSASDYKFVAQKDKMILLDNRERIVARLDVPGNTILNKGMLFFAKGRKVFVIDLKNLLNK